MKKAELKTRQEILDAIESLPENAKILVVTMSNDVINHCESKIKELERQLIKL